MQQKIDVLSFTNDEISHNYIRAKLEKVFPVKVKSMTIYRFEDMIDFFFYNEEQACIIKNKFKELNLYYKSFDSEKYKNYLIIYYNEWKIFENYLDKEILSRALYTELMIKRNLTSLLYLCTIKIGENKSLYPEYISGITTCGKNVRDVIFKNLDEGGFRDLVKDALYEIWKNSLISKNNSTLALSNNAPQL